MFRKALVLVVAVIAIGLGLTGCAGDDRQPVPEQAGSGQQAGSGSGSAADELEGIRSTLDTIDSELAGDGSP
jgi:hypothetical protein